jgi:hypothetical protein
VGFFEPVRVQVVAGIAAGTGVNGKVAGKVNPLFA